MRQYSLKKRALFLLTPFFLVFLLVFAFLIDKAFEHSQIDAMQRQLMLQVRLLLADTDVDKNNTLTVTPAQKSRLKSPEGDLYGYIFSGESDEPLWVSISALAAKDLDLVSDIRALGITGPGVGDQQFLRLNDGFFFAYSVVFELENVVTGETPSETLTRPFTLAVYDNGSAFRLQQKSFRTSLVSGLLLVIALFLTLQYAVLRWLFRPLVSLEQEVSRVEAGDKTHFESVYPSELEPLTSRLNKFVDAERLQRARYKNTLSDLAHSIKTPLAVIRSTVDSGRDDAMSTVQEQVDRMNQIVNYQLKRSVVAAPVGGGHSTEAVVTLRRVLDSVSKIYRERALRLEQKLPDSLFVKLPEADFYELSGNLIENAFKYANSWVSVSLTGLKSEKQTLSSSVALLVIENDGEVFSAQQLAQLTERGVRLDQQPEGQGIGLSVAKLIAESFSGSIVLDQPERGVTRVEVRLPLASH